MESVTPTSLVFAPAAGDLTDRVLYDRVTDNFHFDGLFRATADGHDDYFRFGWQGFDSQRTSFTNLRWANGVVPPAPGVYAFAAVRRDRAQPGNITLATAGDSIT